MHTPNKCRNIGISMDSPRTRLHIDTHLSTPFSLSLFLATGMSALRDQDWAVINRETIIGPNTLSPECFYPIPWIQPLPGQPQECIWCTKYIFLQDSFNPRWILCIPKTSSLPLHSSVNWLTHFSFTIYSTILPVASTLSQAGNWKPGQENIERLKRIIAITFLSC
jgi:hypothetical protein